MKTIFEKTRDLRTVILPERVKFLHLQLDMTPSIFLIISIKFFSVRICSLYEKCTPRILIASVFKFTILTPGSAAKTPLFEPIPAISHLDLFIFSPENFEKWEKTLKISEAHDRLFIKKMVSSA